MTDIPATPSSLPGDISSSTVTILRGWWNIPWIKCTAWWQGIVTGFTGCEDYGTIMCETQSFCVSAWIIEKFNAAGRLHSVLLCITTAVVIWWLIAQLNATKKGIIVKSCEVWPRAQSFAVCRKRFFALFMSHNKNYQQKSTLPALHFTPCGMFMEWLEATKAYYWFRLVHWKHSGALQK